MSFVFDEQCENVQQELFLQLFFREGWQVVFLANKFLNKEGAFFWGFLMEPKEDLDSNKPLMFSYRII